MSKRNIVIGLILQLVLLTGIAVHGSRYNFEPKQTVDIAGEFSKRFSVVDSNLVFGGKVLTITLPGPKGDKGDTGMSGVDGRNGINGKDGIGKPGPVGPSPRHKWEGTRIRFQQPDGTWGSAMELRGQAGPRGRKGNPGLDGLDGRDGALGDPGEDGINGANGSMGNTGNKGDPGTNGTNGQDGMKGDRGVPGKNGKDGESAVFPLFTTMQVLKEVKISNGKLVKTYVQIRVYAQ